MLLLFLGMASSCRPKHRGVHYSPMQVAGTSTVTLVVDSLPFDPRTAPNPFYLELMTAKDTFLVRPSAEEMSFPQLTDSLTQVNLYYHNWYCQVEGQSLRSAYGAVYFPSRPPLSSTIIPLGTPVLNHYRDASTARFASSKLIQAVRGRRGRCGRG